MDKRVMDKVMDKFERLVNNLDKAYQSYQREPRKPKNIWQKIGGFIDAIFITIIMIFVGVCTIPVLALIIAYGILRSLVVKLFKPLNK